jgi:hypothetical protein
MRLLSEDLGIETLEYIIASQYWITVNVYDLSSIDNAVQDNNAGSQWCIPSVRYRWLQYRTQNSTIDSMIGIATLLCFRRQMAGVCNTVQCSSD